MDLTGKSRAVTPPGANPLVVTPDGKFLLAQDPDSNYVYYPLAGGDPKPFPTKLESDDRVTAFEPDGRSVLVFKRGVPARVFRVSLDTNQRELIKEVAPSDVAGVQSVSGSHFQRRPEVLRVQLQSRAVRSLGRGWAEMRWREK